MTGRRNCAGRAARDGASLLGTLVRYGVEIFPIARRELCYWRRRAARITNEPIGRIACGALTNEGLNAEGAALFALLTPLALRATAVRLLVRFQVMYDYLDALTEQPFDGLLAASRQLHQALATALGSPPPSSSYYEGYPAGDDGGYLEELVASCRRAFARFPAACVIRRLTLQAAQRSSEGQSYSHAAACTGPEDLMRWARAASPPRFGLAWWETAAASESSLVIHALLASAADPGLTAEAAQRIASAYWPWIGGLNALLDDLVDLEEDATEGTHSYVTRYPTRDDVAERLGLFAQRASDAIRCLPNSRTHATIFAGMASFYLSALESDVPGASAVAHSVRGGLDIDLRVLLAVMRLRRRLKRRRQDPRDGSSSNASACLGRTTLK